MQSFLTILLNQKAKENFFNSIIESNARQTLKAYNVDFCNQDRFGSSTSEADPQKNNDDLLSLAI